jgi:glycosyltransferase involved in cell wall biosynthesis
VAHGVDGFITKALDVNDLAESIRRLAEDPAGARTMGAAGRARVETRDWSEAATKFWNSSPE